MNPSSVPEIGPEELFRTVEAGDEVQIIDVRSPAKVAAGRIDNVPEGWFINIPGSTLLAATSLAESGIRPGVPSVVVCGHGNDSKVVASHLNRLGADTRSLSGGMTAWMMLSVPRLLKPTPSLDDLIQFDRVGKGALSYLLISSGEALIIDPPRDIRPHLDAIKKANARLVAVVDTHVHADFISGASRIAREFGIPYYLHPEDAVYPYDMTPGHLDISTLRDGMTIPLGRCMIDVLHTPGHSPGSVTYRVDHAIAFTGDFLFITSIGRPDLAAKTEEWSELLWKSLQSAKSTWPQDLVIYPAHYGSQAERRGDGAIGGTLGDLMRRNESLRKTAWPEFLTWVVQHEASFPAEYKSIKAVNVGLLRVDDLEADDLEVGRNECALG